MYKVTEEILERFRENGIPVKNVDERFHRKLPDVYSCTANFGERSYFVLFFDEKRGIRTHDLIIDDGSDFAYEEDIKKTLAEVGF
jgi:hypothetical protein